MENTPNSTPPSGAEIQVTKKETGTRSVIYELFLVSLLALFCELIVIRWLSTEVRIFSYFKNLPLTAAFLGLGLGFLWSGSKRDWFSKSASLFICLSILMICAFNVGITYMAVIDPSKFIMFGVTGSDQFLVTLRNLGIMLGIFALATCIFIGFGQRMGQLFGKLRPLQAYSINVGGSLAGTLLFTLLSWLATPPSVWIACAGILFLIVKRNVMHVAVVVLGLLYGFVLGPLLAHQAYGDSFVETQWSPYYRVDVTKVKIGSGPYAGSLLGYNININYDTFQSILDCSDETIKKFPEQIQTSIRGAYTKPFRLLGFEHPKVLILGSGTGSDVAAALRSGAEKVDCVEIDPQILQIGRSLHPEHPYQSPKVHVFIEDARTYLKNSKERYDLIIFAALDSHTAFSSLSSLRTDNYIFTKEALEEASHLLTDRGVIYEQFVMPVDWLFQRHSATLQTATGIQPVGYSGSDLLNNVKQTSGTLMSGPGIRKVPINDSASPTARRDTTTNPAVPLTTDDWPFLFLAQHDLPMAYLIPLALILMCSTAPMLGHLVDGRTKILNWQMLLLGMGFMLLEVRAMAKISLLLGSTWIVNSFVISIVLIIVLIANWLATKLKQSHLVAVGACLLAALMISQMINVADFLKLGESTAAILATCIYLLPCMFSSCMFALLFSRAQNASEALAFNLIGCIYGVALEYLSMILGINALGVMCISIYVVAIITFMGKVKSPAAQATTPATAAE